MFEHVCMKKEISIEETLLEALGAKRSAALLPVLLLLRTASLFRQRGSPKC